MEGILRGIDTLKMNEVGIMQQVINIKETAHQLIDQLPEHTTWDDVIYKLELRREIEEGLADSEAGRTTPADEVRKEFGL